MDGINIKMPCLSFSIFLFLFRPAWGRLPAATTTSSCSKDEVFSSLMEDDGNFCHSVIDSHCITVSTPTQYTSLGDDVLSSYCECVLTEISATETSSSNGYSDQPTETQYSITGSATSSHPRSTTSSTSDGGGYETSMTEARSSSLSDSNSATSSSESKSTNQSSNGSALSTKSSEASGSDASRTVASASNQTNTSSVGSTQRSGGRSASGTSKNGSASHSGPSKSASHSQTTPSWNNTMTDGSTASGRVTGGGATSSSSTASAGTSAAKKSRSGSGNSTSTGTNTPSGRVSTVGPSTSQGTPIPTDSRVSITQNSTSVGQTGTGTASGTIASTPGPSAATSRASAWNRTMDGLPTSSRLTSDPTGSVRSTALPTPSQASASRNSTLSGKDQGTVSTRTVVSGTGSLTQGSLSAGPSSVKSSSTAATTGSWNSTTAGGRVSSSTTVSTNLPNSASPSGSTTPITGSRTTRVTMPWNNSMTSPRDSVSTGSPTTSHSSAPFTTISGSTVPEPGPWNSTAKHGASSSGGSKGTGVTIPTPKSTGSTPLSSSGGTRTQSSRSWNGTIEGSTPATSITTASRGANNTSNGSSLPTVTKGPSPSRISRSWNGTMTSKPTIEGSSAGTVPVPASSSSPSAVLGPSSSGSPIPSITPVSNSSKSTTSFPITASGWRSTGSLLPTSSGTFSNTLAQSSNTISGSQVSVPWNSSQTGTGSGSSMTIIGTGVSSNLPMPTGASQSGTLTSAAPNGSSRLLSSTMPSWNASISSSVGQGSLDSSPTNSKATVPTGVTTVGTPSGSAGATTSVGLGTGSSESQRTNGSFTFHPSSLQTGSGSFQTKSRTATGSSSTSTSSSRSRTANSLPSSTGAGTNSTATRGSSVSDTAISSGPSPTSAGPKSGINGSVTATWVEGNSTVPTPSAFSAVNFTEVALTASATEEACYHMPKDPDGELSRRALMRNGDLREDNVTVPVPYIQSIDFESGGILPLFMTVRDKAQGTYFVDISNKSRVAISGTEGYSMMIDSAGIHFATNSCRFDLNITATNLFAQLANLSNVNCSIGKKPQPTPSAVSVSLISTNKKRAEDIKFNQTVVLRDQCGSPVTRAIRPYPELRVGDTACQDIEVNESSGLWVFDCTFPGAISGILQCQNAVKNDIIDFLTRDPFGGACPDLSTMISTLSDTSNDILGKDTIQEALHNEDTRSGPDNSSALIESVASGYVHLWESLQGFFIPDNTTTKKAPGPWEQYISTYNEHRSFENDICGDLHTGEIPLSLNIRAGATYVNAITTLNWAPRSAQVYNLKVQDPSAIACCSNGRVADDQGEETCAYPEEAIIADTNCNCGKTADGVSLAFEAAECDNFEQVCEKSSDCETDGFICLIGTCCGGGVCVDPFACSQNGTALVKFGGGW